MNQPDALVPPHQRTMTALPTPDVLDRAIGCLVGLAIGDALGMPTQTLTRAQIVARYGRMLRGFVPSPADHPVAPGLPAAKTTDDTDQALIVADLVIRSGGIIDEFALAGRLADWEDEMVAQGSGELLGPSTRRALEALAAGFGPESSGRTGATNGAAMRIAPVGIAVPPGPALFVAVERASRLTHNTSVAMAGAFAVAAAVSHGVGGGGLAGAIQAAITAAEIGAERGQPFVGTSLLLKRLRRLPGDLAKVSPSSVMDYVNDVTGTSMVSEESVPAALAFALAGGTDGWLALRMAASAGGDCDTVAAMAGAVLGACLGMKAFPEEAWSLVEARNGIDLAIVGEELAHVRAAREADR